MSLLAFCDVVGHICQSLPLGFTNNACYLIGTFYGLLTLLICVMTGNVPAELYAAQASQLALPLAAVLFVVGQVGNGRAVQYQISY